MANLIDPNEAMFTAFEPKQQNRYIFYIEGIPAFLIHKAARPKITQETVTLEHINVTRYVGKGAFITEADFGTLDWTATNAYNEIAMSIQCDYWILQF